MSILLDAVIRNKQQGQLPDPATAPRSYEQAQRRWPVKATAAVVISLLAGGGAAFGLNLLLNKEDAGMTVTAPVSASVTIPAPEQALVPAQASNSAVVKPGAKSTQSAEVRLAGRGNLPVAQPSPVTHASGANRSGTLPAMASQTQRDMRPTTAAVPSPATVSSGTQPLVLGANTDLTPEQLEILRREAGTSPEGMADLGREAREEQENLLAAFEQALKEVEYQHSVNDGVTPKSLDPIPEPQDTGLPKYGDLPLSLQQQVPDFNIVAHVYASNPNNRWLNVDGRELQQGDTIGGKLKIVEIRPRDVILEIGGTEFTVPAI